MKARAKESPRSLSAKAEAKAAKSNGRSNEFCVKDPVNPITGEVVLTQTDFELPWRLPLVWTRHYGTQGEYEGCLGRGWQSPADARLELDEDGLVTFFDGTPKGAVFPGLPEGEPVMEVAGGAMLEASGSHYLMRLKAGLNYRFAGEFTNGCSQVEEITDADGRLLRFIRRAGQLVEIRMMELIGFWLIVLMMIVC